MENPIDKSIVKNIDAIDFVSGTIAKPFIEKGMSQIVGNGTFISAAAKLGGALMVAKYGGNNRFAKAIAIGAGQDGAEDAIIALGIRGGINPEDDVGGGVF
jgi:hypothetical protein